MVQSFSFIAQLTSPKNEVKLAWFTMLTEDIITHTKQSKELRVPNGSQTIKICCSDSSVKSVRCVRSL